jgi:uncharacterized membrane protein
MPSPDRKILAAALLGAAGGMRSLTPEAVLVARGKGTRDATARRAILLAAAGELVADKLPWVPARIKPGPYLGRISSGAFSGRSVAGQDGALAGAAASAITTFLGYQARMAARRRSAARGFVAALVEDALAIGTASAAVSLLDD